MCDLYSSLWLVRQLLAWLLSNISLPSVVGWQEGHPACKKLSSWVLGCWRGCLGWGADLHIAQQMLLPLTISCSSKSRLVLAFLIYLSGTCSPGWSRTYSRRAVKRLCVVCVCVSSGYNERQSQKDRDGDLVVQRQNNEDTRETPPQQRDVARSRYMEQTDSRLSSANSSVSK